MNPGAILRIGTFVQETGFLGYFIYQLIPLTLPRSTCQFKHSTKHYMLVNIIPCRYEVT